MPDQMVSFADALRELDIHPGDRVLIMLPDGPGFTEALTVITQRGAVPLPVSPLTAEHDVSVVAAAAGAHLVLLPMNRIGALTGLVIQPPVLLEGPQGPWVAALRLRWPMRLR